MTEPYTRKFNGVVFYTTDVGGLIFDNRKKADKAKYFIKNLCEKEYMVRILPVGRKYQILTHPRLTENDQWYLINQMSYF